MEIGEIMFFAAKLYDRPYCIDNNKNKSERCIIMDASMMYNNLLFCVNHPWIQNTIVTMYSNRFID